MRSGTATGAHDELCRRHGRRVAGAARPQRHPLLLIGMLAGTFVGVVPGLGGAVLLTMLLPFLYGLNVVQGLALMVSAHASIYFAGSITAILLNTPGAPESAPTTIDGYQMTRQGKAARALGISAAATTLGGWIGFAALIGVIPLMFPLIKILRPPEFLLLAILAVVLVSQLHSGSLTKGLLSGIFGFLMAFVGYDPITGVQRFSFNLLALYDGFNIVVVALGLFAMSEMYHLYGAKRALAGGVTLTLSDQPGARVIDGVWDVYTHRWLVLRSAAIGVLVGLVPGVGGIAGNFISYGQAVRTSRHPERFGTGTPEGIIAPESSSLAKEASSFIPTLALGIPSTVGTAVMLGALQILGVPPGPTMLTTNLSLVFTIAWALAITSLFASLIGLALARWLARITLLPGPILVPFVYRVGHARRLCGDDQHAGSCGRYRLRRRRPYHAAARLLAARRHHRIHPGRGGAEQPLPDRTCRRLALRHPAAGRLCCWC